MLALIVVYTAVSSFKQQIERRENKLNICKYVNIIST